MFSPIKLLRANRSAPLLKPPPSPEPLASASAVLNAMVTLNSSTRPMAPLARPPALPLAELPLIVELVSLAMPLLVLRMPPTLIAVLPLRVLPRMVSVPP